MRGNHHRLDRRVVALDLLEQLQAIEGRCLIEGRRLDVNEHEIGMEVGKSLTGCFAALGRCDFVLELEHHA